MLPVHRVFVMALRRGLSVNYTTLQELLADDKHETDDE
jgi:hypothetical protein